MSPDTSWQEQGAIDDDRPTAKQLAYLRVLADRAGQTFSYPRTRRQASEQIRCLRAATPTSHDERRIERHEIADAIAHEPGDDARVDVDHEVTGFGSTARWRRDDHPTATIKRDVKKVGPIVELARYAISSGERVLQGQRIGGVVRVSDHPAKGPGRSYLVERGLEQDGNAALRALVAEYVAQAKAHNRVPMETSALRSEFEQLAGDAER